MVGNVGQTRISSEMKNLIGFRNSFGVLILRIALLSLLNVCSSEIDTYVVDDSDNLILNEDYYGPPSPPRYPVYLHPTPVTTPVPAPIPKSKPGSGNGGSGTRSQDPVSESPLLLPLPSSNILDPGDEVRLERPVAEVFLTRGNTEETIPLSGEYTKDIVVSEEMVRNGTEFNHVVLLCNAPYAVEWIYEGVGAPRSYTTQIRTFGDFFKPNTYGHSSIVVLVQERYDERQTGTYICQGIEHQELRTKFHLYFKGEFGFPSLQNVVVQPHKNDASVLIPCPTTDPTATIGLYKIAPVSETRNLTFEGSFAYDPRKGFSLNLADMSNPFGTYVCKFMEVESLWNIDVMMPKDEEIIVIPNATTIHMNNLANHNFICMAKEPIQIMLPNTVDFGRVEYIHNASTAFPYGAMLSITPNVPISSVANYFKVNCQSRKTRRILHTWEYSNFGTEEIKVSYDKDQKRLLCCSKSGLTPIHELAKCETVTDCNIKKNCFNSGQCDYAFPPKFVDAPRGCTAIEFMDDFPSHVMRCSVGKFSEMMMVTSNIANDNLMIYDGTVPDNEEILKIVTLGQKRNEVQVRCVASIFYFSTNIMFAFEAKDGSLRFADESMIENVSSYGPTLRATVPPETTRIFCFAPVTRSSEWRNVSLSVVTLDLINQQPLKTLPDSEPEGQENSEPFVDDGDTSPYEKVLTSVKTSTSVTTFLRKKRGHLVKVLQDTK